MDFKTRSALAGSCEVILEASGLVKTFGEIKAVDNVSLKIQRGKCVALLGPNGAGKTTICEMLEGLIEPDRGSISLFKKSYHTNKKEILESIGAQLQETNLYRKYTVLETLELFASFYKKPVCPQAMIKKLGLEAKAHMRLEHLSGGWRQRAYLGTALINNPQLVFLDEPTAGLDPQARRDLWDFISSLKTEGASILLTTHYLEEAETLADWVVIIDQGRLIAEGSVASLAENHCDPAVLEFSIKEDPYEWTRMAGGFAWGSSVKESSHGRFTLSGDSLEERLWELSGAMKSRGLHFGELRLRKPTLEDVFLKLTGRRLRG